MKKVWKWILGILIALIILSILVTAAFIFRGAMFERAGLQNSTGPGWYPPMMGNGNRWNLPSPEGFDEYRHPMMRSRVFFPFMGHGLFFGMGLLRLIPWVLVGLVIYGAYRYGVKRAVPTKAVLTPQALERTCSKCGQIAQDTWQHCPSCGMKLE